MKWLTSDNKMLGYELMKAYPNISCFSTTRHGGCSKGNYTSFNCNGYCGDEAEDVNRNRELLRSLLPGESVELVIPHQTHSDHVKVVERPTRSNGNFVKAESFKIGRASCRERV